MSDFVPGSMDTTAQEKTFAGFMRMVSWGAIIVVVILIVLALADADADQRANRCPRPSNRSTP